MKNILLFLLLFPHAFLHGSHSDTIDKNNFSCYHDEILFFPSMCEQPSELFSPESLDITNKERDVSLTRQSAAVATLFVFTGVILAALRKLR